MTTFDSLVNSLLSFSSLSNFQGVGILAKSTTFAKSPRQLQFEADINKLFMFTRLVFVCNEVLLNKICSVSRM